MAESKYDIFDCFSNNLELVDSSYKGLYRCPICLKLFKKADLENNVLTVEHIIPEKLGGKIFTLTCKTCNSECGTYLDVHLINKIFADEVLSGKSSEPLNAEIEIGDGLTRGDLYIQQKGGKSSVKFVGKPNMVHPAALEKCSKALSEGLDEIKLSGNLGYKVFNLQIALIKIAYLLLFSRLGYGYILNNPLEEIREQIRSPGKKLIKPTIMNISMECKTQAEAIFVYYPERYRCFGSTYTLSKLTNKTVMVALPGLSGQNSNTAELFNNYDGKKGNLKYKIIPYKPSRLEREEPFCFSKSLWKEAFDENTKSGLPRKGENS